MVQKTKGLINKPIKTKIKYYRFDISKSKDKKEYFDLKLSQKEKGIKLFDSISLSSYADKEKFFNKIKELEKKGFVELDTSYIFNNQWNTTEKSFNLRVFDWSEKIYPNKDIKEGYYLEVNNQMREIRDNTFICGYCGKHYTKKQQESLSFCNDCLDSEYLEERDLFLLRLKRISDQTERLPLNDCDKETLKGVFKDSQIIGQQKRTQGYFKKALKNIEEDKKTTIDKARIEYKGKKWLLDRGINIENVIYYSHTKTWCFGWRNNLTFNEEQSFKKVLGNKKDQFPFKYELKV